MAQPGARHLRGGAYACDQQGCRQRAADHQAPLTRPKRFLVSGNIIIILQRDGIAGSFESFCLFPGSLYAGKGDGMCRIGCDPGFYLCTFRFVGIRVKANKKPGGFLLDLPPTTPD